MGRGRGAGPYLSFLRRKGRHLNVLFSPGPSCAKPGPVREHAPEQAQRRRERPGGQERNMAKLSKVLKGATLVVALGALAAVAVGLFFQPAVPQKQFGGMRRGGDGPVPVVSAPARMADVPVYLEGVGTVRALNTVT